MTSITTTQMVQPANFRRAIIHTIVPTNTMERTGKSLLIMVTA